MNISEIYDRYKIMPQLQAHQLRVAAVAKMICDNFEGELDEEAIITACLLHDMGNILKFDLSVFPKFTEREGLDYWQAVKEDYLKRYGRDVHPATLAIVQEIGVSSKVQELVDAIGFSQGEANAASEDYERKVCAYSDMRVGPHAVLTLEDRLNDLALRYGSKYKDDKRRDQFSRALRQIEEQVFSKSKIKPADINDDSCAPIIEQLKTYEIQADSL